LKTKSFFLFGARGTGKSGSQLKPATYAYGKASALLVIAEAVRFNEYQQKDLKIFDHSF
jgi:predicted AAA+ superfamily ATPase